MSRNSNNSPVINTGLVDNSGFAVYEWGSVEKYAAHAPHTPAPKTPRHTVGRQDQLVDYAVDRLGAKATYSRK